MPLTCILLVLDEPNPGRWIGAVASDSVGSSLRQASAQRQDGPVTTNAICLAKGTLLRPAAARMRCTIPISCVS